MEGCVAVTEPCVGLGKPPLLSGSVGSKEEASTRRFDTTSLLSSPAST